LLIDSITLALPEVIIGTIKMGGVLISLIGLAGYILPAPSLIWGWVRWWNTKPRFAPDRWRRISAFGGLILASCLGLFVLFVIGHAIDLAADSAASSAERGFQASIVALVLSLVGNGPARLPASLASFGLAALCFIGAFLY